MQDGLFLNEDLNAIEVCDLMLGSRRKTPSGQRGGGRQQARRIQGQDLWATLFGPQLTTLYPCLSSPSSPGFVLADTPAEAYFIT